MHFILIKKNDTRVLVLHGKCKRGRGRVKEGRSAWAGAMTCSNKHLMNPDTGFPWDIVRHSRWRKLKTCNYIFLWGYSSSSQIFIKARCSRCNRTLASIHPQKPALLSSFNCGALFFYWNIWFSWHINDHFHLHMNRLLWLDWGLRFTQCTPTWRHIELSQWADAYKI